MIGIVSYGVGNLRSLSNALEWLGESCRLVERGEEFDAVTGLILPGVGAFGPAMEQLKNSGLDRDVQAWVARGRPLLGICLGVQLLARRSEERGKHEGLAIVPADVALIPKRPGIRIPHMGWNTVTRVRDSVLWGDLRSIVCYHVHSYALAFDEQAASEWVIGTVEHGQRIPTMIHCGNVMGTQFHPEKSQRDGLAVLANFLQFVRQC